jgi:hypothetical protein
VEGEKGPRERRATIRPETGAYRWQCRTDAVSGKYLLYYS